MSQPEINALSLVARAVEARRFAYAPYSNYTVGAAVLTADGRVFTGCNVENALYPLCTCAERVAITKAVSEGAHQIVALAVATGNGGTPCGSCRQTLREFADPQTPVFIAWPDGHYRATTLAALLPDSFSAADLKQ
jgi:cytidine deaminase